MLKRVQHDRDERDRIGGWFIEGTIPSLQDDKETELLVGRRVYSSTKRFLPSRNDK